MSIHTTVFTALFQMQSAATMTEFQDALTVIHAIDADDLSTGDRETLLALLEDLEPAIELFAAKARAELAIRHTLNTAFVNFAQRALGGLPTTVQ